MMILIMGGSGSGKSAYAEECIGMLSQNCNKYYIATMQVFGKEGLAKVKRHREMRNGKGFHTIEQTVDIQSALDKMNVSCSQSNTALLECMSNLVANEMFSGDGIVEQKVVIEKITNGISVLSKGVKHLVIVSNNVFDDGIVYDKSTKEYLQALGRINEKMAEMADKVIEVVVGIPLVVKE